MKTDKPRYLILDFEIAGKCYSHVDVKERIVYWQYFSDVLKMQRDETTIQSKYTTIDQLEPDVKEQVLKTIWNEYCENK